VAAGLTSKLRASKRAVVEEGLPKLNEELAKAGVNTPRRLAAFLTTIGHESMFEYNIKQFNDTRVYAGRGYIQLTGSYNYQAVGWFYDIDLLGTPDLALSLDWSAKIACWYWTVARPHCNEYADNLQMGKVNAAIGFPEGTSDQKRCTAFGAAIQYLTGETPAGISCTR